MASEDKGVLSIAAPDGGFDVWEPQLLREHAALLAATASVRFEQLERFCLFIGYPRSGHSLVGALLDAHPSALISHELDVLQFMHVQPRFGREELFALIVENSAVFAGAGRQWSDFSYRVEGQWQGRSEELAVIGDKKGGRTSLRLASDPWLLDELAERIQLDLTLVHVIRNPFDNIATMARRDPASGVDGAIVVYRACLEENARQRLSGRDIVDIHHENFAAEPERCLDALCRRLGLVPSASYLRACSGIVREPHRSRSEVRWTTTQRSAVSDLIESHDFLYVYADDGI